MSESVAKDVIERIPLFDGSMRRRLFGGLIAVGTVYWSYDISLLPDTVKISEVINSWVFAAGALLLVFAVGALVEILAAMFVRRAMGAVVWSLKAPLRIALFENRFLRGLMICLLYLLAVYYIVVVSFLSFIGFARFRLPLWAEDSTETGDTDPERRKLLNNLNAPYQTYFDASWRHLTSSLKPGARRSIVRWFALCEDIVMATTAALVAIVIFLTSPKRPQIPDSATTRSDGAANLALDATGETSFYLVILGAVLAIGAWVHHLALGEAVENTRYLLTLPSAQSETDDPDEGV